MMETRATNNSQGIEERSSRSYLQLSYVVSVADGIVLMVLMGQIQTGLAFMVMQVFS